MFNEAQNFAITRTQLDAVFFQNFDSDEMIPGRATANTSALFKPIQTEHSAWIQQINKGSGYFSPIGETQTVPLSTPHVTNQQTIVVQDWANSIQISKDLFDDNLHGVWSKDVEDFSMVARSTQNNAAFGVFRGAFTTTLTADGVSAINSAHPLIGGGTVSNVVPSAAPLSNTTINTAIVLLAQQKNQSNVILGNTPTILLVPSKLFTTAIQITESALISDTANNAINVYRSAYGITVYTSPFLDAVAGGSDTAWFLLSRNHSVSRLIRQGIETALTPWQYSNNRTYTYQANYRESYFISDYSGLVGSTGI